MQLPEMLQIAIDTFYIIGDSSEIYHILFPPAFKVLSERCYHKGSSAGRIGFGKDVYTVVHI
jgi:hypothetical protein